MIVDLKLKQSLVYHAKKPRGNPVWVDQKLGRLEIKTVEVICNKLTS